MTGFEAYTLHLAVKLHFTSEKYDIFENRARVKASEASFNKRRDKPLFDMVANKFRKKPQLIDFLAANYAYGNNAAIWEFDRSVRIHKRWIARKESMTKRTEDDLQTILEYISSEGTPKTQVFHFTYSTQPSIMVLLNGGDIGIETVFILNKYIRFMDNWLASPFSSVMAENFLVINKLNRFVRYDKSKMDAVMSRFSERLRVLYDPTSNNE